MTLHSQTLEKKPEFVVHKHKARRLHYDLRLEVKGVLKSWALPKGPPKESGEKRLAISVEDHPFNYKNFEGIIPEGMYGAGEVKIWDHGTYSMDKLAGKDQTESAVLRNLKEGHLKLFFHGKKLKGQFVLIQLSGEGNENHWLMVRK